MRPLNPLPLQRRPVLLCLLALLLSGAAVGCDSSGSLNRDRCAGTTESPTSDATTEVEFEVKEIVLSVSGGTIEFAASKDGFAKLTLHDSRGQRVQELFSGCVEGDSFYQLRPQPTGLSPGVYSIRLRFEGQTRTAMLRIVPQ